MTGTVYLVHAIDTEGPLYEPLEAKFSRLRETFGLESVEVSQLNLNRLTRGEIDLGKKTQVVRDALQSHAKGTLGSWDSINEMLDRVCAGNFRLRFPDSDGKGWIFNWFCMDHVGYLVNPRRRDQGFLNVHDRYAELISSQPDYDDSLEFHFHAMSVNREAHRCATFYFRDDSLFESLSRRIIDRNFFPVSYRAGFHAERPDSHWFLEQFIPYDISNMATETTHDIDSSMDFRMGRLGNWRRAPSDWSVYHPSHDDYQVPGNCRRLIGRALHIDSRLGRLTQIEIDKAFSRAQSGLDTVLGMCSHDWRDLEPEIKSVHEMLHLSVKKFPEVRFKYSTCREAFKSQLPQAVRAGKSLDLGLTFNAGKQNVEVPFIEVRVKSGQVFGPQPFLAIKTKGQRYLYDNFDFGDESGVWYYAFREDTLPLNQVETIGVAANDILGNTSILKFKP